LRATGIRRRDENGGAAEVTRRGERARIVVNPKQ
jgi:hypothetical protein